MITTYTNSDIPAPAENRTRGPTMATLDFTTKPLALAEPTKQTSIHRHFQCTHQVPYNSAPTTDHLGRYQSTSSEAGILQSLTFAFDMSIGA